MKISQNYKTVRFGRLKEGDVFMTINGKQFYMKTEHKTGCNLDAFNTVHLESGALYETPDAQEVIPVNCELVIK